MNVNEKQRKSLFAPPGEEENLVFTLKANTPI